MGCVSDYILLLLRTCHLLIPFVIVAQESSYSEILWRLWSGLSILKSVCCWWEIFTVLDLSGSFLLGRASQRICELLGYVCPTACITAWSYFLISLLSKSFHTVSAGVLRGHGSWFLFLQFDLLLLRWLLLNKGWGASGFGRGSSCFILWSGLWRELRVVLLRSLDSLGIMITDLLRWQNYLLLAVLSLHWSELLVFSVPLAYPALAVVFSLTQRILTGCFGPFLWDLRLLKLIRVILLLLSSFLIK